MQMRPDTLDRTWQPNPRGGYCMQKNLSWKKCKLFHSHTYLYNCTWDDLKRLHSFTKHHRRAKKKGIGSPKNVLNISGVELWISGFVFVLFFVFGKTNWPNALQTNLSIWTLVWQLKLFQQCTKTSIVHQSCLCGLSVLDQFRLSGSHFFFSNSHHSQP